MQNEYRINEEIDAKEVRLIDEAGKQVGVIAAADALRLAEEREYDLVEVAPEAQPPVCRIMNFGKYKYEQQKKEHQARRRSHAMEIKELRLGRSLMVDRHDIMVKLKKARELLEHGYRLLAFIQLRGREMAHSEMANERLTEFAKALEDISKIEQSPSRDRRRISMLLVPLPHAGKKKEAKKPAPAALAEAKPGMAEALSDDESLAEAFDRTGAERDGTGEPEALPSDPS